MDTGDVLLVDDRPGARSSLRALIADACDARVDEVEDERALLAELARGRSLRVAVILWELKDGGGLAAAKAMWLLAPRTPVVFVTTRSDVDEDFSSRLSAQRAPVALLELPLRRWDLRAAFAKLGVIAGNDAPGDAGEAARGGA